MKERNIWEENFYPEDLETNHGILFGNLCRILGNPSSHLIPVPPDFPKELMQKLPGEKAVVLLVELRREAGNVPLQPDQLEKEARALVNGYRYASYLSWKYKFNPTEYLI